eukprot:31323-Pelagococcus_subviridis.AAC.30
MQLVLDRVLDLRADVAALPVAVALSVRDVSNARQRNLLRKLRGERGQTRVQTPDERPDVPVPGVVLLHALDALVHVLRRLRVVVRAVVPAVLDARDGADADPEEVDGAVSQRVHVHRARVVKAQDALQGLELLPPRRRVAVAFDDPPRRVREVVHVPLVVPVLVVLSVALELDGGAAPVGEERHVVAAVVLRRGRGRRRRRALLLVVVVLLLLRRRRRWRIVVLLLRRRRRGRGRPRPRPRPAGRSERLGDVDEDVPAVALTQPLLAVLRADQHRHARDVPAHGRELDRPRPVRERGLARLRVRGAAPRGDVLEEVVRRKPRAALAIGDAPVQQKRVPGRGAAGGARQRDSRRVVVRDRDVAHARGRAGLRGEVDRPRRDDGAVAAATAAADVRLLERRRVVRPGGGGAPPAAAAATAARDDAGRRPAERRHRRRRGRLERG